MYTNLLLFLVAIFLFSVASIPETPTLSPVFGLPMMAVLYWLYSRVAKRSFTTRPEQASNYFRTEKVLSIIALCFFGITLYLCDPKYYIIKLPYLGTAPALVNVAGLLLFVAYLALMWRAGRPSYELLFGRKHSTASFIKSNVKANLPIVLPWIVLSLIYDIVAMLPFTGLQDVIASQWGDLFFFAIFLCFVLLFFPPLVKSLWGCKKLPDGFLKQRLDDFCKTHNFNADFYLWPLFEGRVLTAGVMGIVPGLRYILITPALIETMSISELEAVMAHEIGHVKKRHLLLYVMLISGFGLFAGMLAEPIIYLLLSLNSLNNFIMEVGVDAPNIITIVGGVFLLLFLLIYFRFIFGYFIRNFERQADLFSLSVVGSSEPLVSAFEKIAVLSGNIRNQPNWHHFGIGQRIDCLQAAQQQPERIEAHNRKVRWSLLGYIIAVIITVGGASQIPTEALQQRYQEKINHAFFIHKAAQEPDRAIWQVLIGNLMLNKKMESKALEAFEKAFSLDPVNPDVMNNLAWLLLTSKDLTLRDPMKALTLARGAATLQPKGYILDTLATAYWANGLVDEAVRVEKQAVLTDAAKRRFYLAQILKFTSQSYEESLKELASPPVTGEG